MLLDVSACRPAFLDHEQPGYPGGSPAEPLEADAAGQPHLGIVSAERLLDRGQLGLELDDQQRPRARVPREQIDRAALAIHREGHLGRDLPARRLQHSSRRFSEACMPGVEEAVEVAAAPPHEQDEIRVQGPDDFPERRQREPLDAAPSTSEIIGCDTPALAASSRCVQPSRCRNTRAVRPIRASSTSGEWRSLLTGRSPAAYLPRIGRSFGYRARA